MGGIKTERDTSWCMRERERERVITLTQNREQAERIGKVSLARCLVDPFPLSPVNISLGSTGRQSLWCRVRTTARPPACHLYFFIGNISSLQ